MKNGYKSITTTAIRVAKYSMERYSEDASNKWPTIIIQSAVLEIMTIKFVELIF